MGKTLTICDIPEEIYRRFVEIARQNHRTAEACGRFLIEQETQPEASETCGEILDAYVELPPPKVKWRIFNFIKPAGGAGPTVHSCSKSCFA